MEVPLGGRLGVHANRDMEGWRDGGRDGLLLSAICLVRERSMQEQENAFVWCNMCWYVCLLLLCVCVRVCERRRQDQKGGAGPQSVPLPLLSPATNLLNQLCSATKTENNNNSKQRTSLLSPNGFKSSLPVVTTDERIIKHRTVLTERSQRGRLSLRHSVYS